MLRGKNLNLFPVFAGILALGTCLLPLSSQAQTPANQLQLAARGAPTYADLVTFGTGSNLVAQVKIKGQIRLPDERAPGLAPNMARLYIRAETQTLYSSPRRVGERLVFLVDVPLRANGKPPKLKKSSFVIFGLLSTQREGEVQLLTSKAMLPISTELDNRLRHVLTQIAQADVLPPVTGVGDVIWVPGNLAGESETQLSVQTQGGMPVSVSVLRRPGMAAQWGVSTGEIVDPSARPPAPETVEWFRLACQLPRQLPQEGFLQRDRNAQAHAREDYAIVLNDLGPCLRNLSEE